MGSLRIAVLVVALFALHALAMPAYARIGSCGGCGTVIDVDAIYYASDKAPDGAAVGAIVGGTPSKHVGANRKAAATPSVATSGLIGRAARGSDQGDDERGLRLEIKMDGGGQRTIEVGEGLRIYKGDRVRVFSSRIEILD